MFSFPRWSSRAPRIPIASFASSAAAMDGTGVPCSLGKKIDGPCASSNTAMLSCPTARTVHRTWHLRPLRSNRKIWSPPCMRPSRDGLFPLRDIVREISPGPVPRLPRLNYYRRIVSAYLLGGKSHLTFWHETPEENLNANPGELGEYYMLFAEKADYDGAFDSAGIPQLDYRGKIGRQYNPIAIAQYGLGNYNFFRRTGDGAGRKKFLLVAEWLRTHLEKNPQGLPVWNHYFDWEYRDTLRAPWYSALAQGQGISMLVRAHKESGDIRYIEAAKLALASFFKPVTDGGVIFTDEHG